MAQAGGGDPAETPRERIDRLVAEGKMPREAVDTAEALWQDRLQHGVAMPSGERVVITLDDLYHLIVDDRIWRKPERIEAAIIHVYEIRRAEMGRRRALSRWTEDGQECLAAAILDEHGGLRALHLIDTRRLARYIRKGGQTLWRW